MLLRTRDLRASVVTLACTLLFAAVASAQETSGIAGVVTDATGAVLPGVTVEAASPVLIEKVRAVVTDGQGQYKIVDLRPGTYGVTFTLPGFTTVRREGVELTSGFTARVETQMRVGALGETVTVTGASPQVDVQSVLQQQVLSTELLDSLPTSSKNLASLQSMIVGLSNTSALSAANVGGAQGEFRLASQTGDLFHGKPGGKTLFDGMRTQATHPAGTSGWIVNPYTVEESTVETGGASAESIAASILISQIPKEGGNTFQFSVAGFYTNSDLQGNNLTDELRARGLTTVGQIDNLYDAGATVGGPVKKDRFWFFFAHRNSGSSNQQPGLFFNKTQGTVVYTPDLSRPAVTNEHLRSDGVRLTWQASRRNKISFFGDNQRNCVCRYFVASTAVEALSSWVWHPGLYTATWNSVVSNRLLLEAGAAVMRARYDVFRQPEVSPNQLSIRDTRAGFLYNSSITFGSPQVLDRYSQRFSASYITGSHAFKAGFQLGEGVNRNPMTGNDFSYQFLGTTPSAIEQYARPLETKNQLKAELGLFVQDRWTVKRLTLNLGLRFEYYNSYVPPQSAPAGPYVAARDFGPVYRRAELERPESALRRSL